VFAEFAFSILSLVIITTYYCLLLITINIVLIS